MHTIGSVPRIGLSTKIFDNPEDIAVIAKIILDHFTDIEIELEDDAKSAVYESSNEEYRKLVARLRKTLPGGNRQISVHAPYLSRSTDLAASDKSVRIGAINQVRRAIWFCADIGSDRVTYHPGFIDQGDDKTVLTDNLKRSIDRLQQEAELLGIRLCLENMGNGRPKYLVYSPEEHADLHEQTGTWMTLDLVHLASWCVTPEEVDRQMAIYAPITANIHINDILDDRHLPLSRGALPIAQMLQRLHEYGYCGAAIIDEFAKPIPAHDYRRSREPFALSANA